MTEITRQPGDGIKDAPLIETGQIGWTKPQLVRLVPGGARHRRALAAFGQAGTRAA
ncbi:MAG: hypothetical protein O9283_14150 [Sphingomonadaceae bacterium]|nr:hypothetical protein [Sphingomonadaceae bacterium]